MYGDSCWLLAVGRWLLAVGRWLESLVALVLLVALAL